MVRAFRGGTAAELIPFRLDDGEDLVETLARMAEELNLGAAALAMGGGALASVRLTTPGSPGPLPLGIVAEYQGPLPIVAMQGWILAGQPEVQLTLSRSGALIAGRAVAGCPVQGAVEGLLLRVGNLRLARLPDPQTGAWSLTCRASWIRHRTRSRTTSSCPGAMTCASRCGGCSGARTWRAGTSQRATRGRTPSRAGLA